MRKKFFSALLLMTLAVPLTGALVSCSDYDDDISSLRDDVTSLKSQLETTKSDLEAQLTTIKGDFAAQIQAAVEGKADKSEVEELKVSLDAAESKLQAQIDAINEALEGLDAGKINDAIETLAAVTGDVEKLKTDVDGIDQRVGAVEKNLKIQQDALAAFLEAIQSNGYENVDELIAAVKDAQGTISELQDKVSANASDITTLKGFMEDAEEALATLNTTVAGLQGQIDALTVYIEKMLSGLVFAPDFYYGGIEAMEATTIEYTPIVLSNNSTLEKPEVETWKNLKMNAYLTPDIVAKYHMNPSYFDVTKIKSMKVVSDDKEYVEIGNTRAAASAPSVVEGSWLNSKDGMLSATINLDANAVKDDPSHVTVLAVQACFNGKDGKDSVVTSDYAAVAKSTIRNVVIADPLAEPFDPLKGICTLRKFHVYTFAKDAIANAPTHDLVYNDPEGVDLTKLAEAHFNRNGNSMEQVMEDVSKYGMKWEFAVSHYTAGSNKTSESAHIYLKDNHAIACTVDASGKPQPGSQDRSSLDRLPMVRVTLVDTTKTENNIVAVGFIKFKIVEKAAEPADDINISFSDDGYELSCTDYNYTLTWAQIEDKVLGELNLSKHEFETLYKVETGANGCQLYEKNAEGLPVQATQYGVVTEKVDAQHHETSVLSWTVTAAEVYRAVWDATKGAYKTGVNLETGVKFIPTDNTKPAVYVWFHSGTITTPTAALENSAKIKENWAATNGTMGSGFDEIHNNVEVYGQAGANDEFINDILSTFVGNKITLNTTGGAFANGKLTYDFRFVINDAYKTQTGLSGKVYTLSVSSDGHTLYAASAAGLPEEVAKLVGSKVYYQKTATAKDLLNAASHNNLAKTMTATVGIYAENGCDMELPIAGNMFDMKFLRPIDVVGADDVTFTDAIDHGNTKDVAELVKFTDWRDQWLEAYIGYYGVTAITADIDDITTTLNGGTLGKTLLSDVNPKLKFSQTGVGTEGEYGNVMFGQLLYENNGQVTGTFKVRVPLTVTYDWGEVKTYVDITIENTKANKVARH